MTFHRAIDMTRDVFKAADTVRDLGKVKREQHVFLNFSQQCSVSWRFSFRSRYRLGGPKLPKQCSIITHSSVVDPWYFGTDPDPRIRASDQWIRIRILLFSSLTFKMPTKKNYFFCLLLFEGTVPPFTSFFQYKKS
jgi:hypothetical protein